MSLADRRDILLGGAALAVLLDSQAKADTAWTSFAFTTQLGSTNRTMPVRLSEIKNVRDYGALANGGDDQPAIQSAIDDISSPYSAPNRGIIFFPAGTYTINNPLSFELGASFVATISGTTMTVLSIQSGVLQKNQIITGAAGGTTILSGSGSTWTVSINQTVSTPTAMTSDGIHAISFIGAPGATITGTFADALLKRSVYSPVGGAFLIENLIIKNNDPAGKGIMFHSTVGSKINCCQISAVVGIECGNSQSVTVDSTSIINNGAGGQGTSVGVVAGNATTLIAADISAMSYGVTHANAGLTVIGGRWEVNTVSACDLGNNGYAAGSFTFGITATGNAPGTTNLTLSGITGAPINTGTFPIPISGAGIPANTTITAFQSGVNGGNGVYTTNNSLTLTNITVTILTPPLNNGTITLNGTTWTFVTAAPSGNQIQIGASLSATLNNSWSALNNSADAQTVKCVYTTDAVSILNITSKKFDTSMNSYTLASSSSPASNATRSGGTLTNTGSSTSVFVTGVSMESNFTGFSASGGLTAATIAGLAITCSKAGRVAGINFTANPSQMTIRDVSVSNADASGWSTAGINIAGGNYVTLENITNSTTAGAGNISLCSGTNSNFRVINVTSVVNSGNAWTIGNGADIEFENCPTMNTFLPTLANLPAASVVQKGARRQISNSNDATSAQVYGATVNIGGAHTAKVWSDGTNWVYG